MLTYIHRIDNGKDLIRYSVELARDLKRDLDMLYTIELQNHPMGVPGAARPNFEVTQEQIQNILDEIGAEMEKRVGQVKKSTRNPPDINYFTRQGISHYLVREFVRNNNYDNVIVAANAKNELLINDRNMDIIKSIDCPVWVIPEGIKYKPIKRIIYATDYGEEDIHTLKMLVKIAEKSEAGITALHIHEDLDFEERVKKSGFNDLLAKEVGYKDTEMVTMSRDKDKSLSETINKFAKDIGADLIAVLRENKNFFDKLLRKSETKKLINVADLPVLVYQEKK